MKTSAEIDKISEALSMAQAEFKPLVKNKINPHFKSHFADLAASIDATRDALTKYGLAILQGCHVIEGAGSLFDGRLIMVTRLVHKSGQWFEIFCSLKPAQDTPQAIGSAMTYGRRYGRNAILDLAADDDDDGNAATQKAPAPVAATVQKAPTMFELFANHGIAISALESYLRAPKDKWTGEDKGKLRAIYNDLESKKMDKDDFMTLAWRNISDGHTQ